MNFKLFIYCFFLISKAYAEGLGMGGGPPADLTNPIVRPVFPIANDSTTNSNDLPLFERHSHLQRIDDGVLCRESASSWKSINHSNQELGRWPLEEDATCLSPLKEFSSKLSFSKAPLALSFATFVDGLEKHLNDSTVLGWKNCLAGCTPKNTPPAGCIEPTVLIQRVSHLPNTKETYVINKIFWDSISTKHPRVCAATVVDLWLSTHVIDKEMREKMVNDFFSAKFHANAPDKPRCFDPTLATKPLESFDGQINGILRRLRQ